MEFINEYINFIKKNCFIRIKKRRLSIAVSKKKLFFGGHPGQEIRKIEICTWNKKTNFS